MLAGSEVDGRPLITVIITSYNYAHYLRTSIGSVLAQDFPSFELLVVDNASTDGTDALVSEYAHDERLRYVKNPVNIGLTPNHNRGLSLAHGAYILFLSADDMILPGHLRRCYDYLQAHPKTDVLYTGAMFMNAEGAFTGARAMGGQLPVDYDGGRNEFAQQLCEGCYLPYPAMLIRRSLYDELGPMDERFVAADYEITVRWAAAGKRFAYLRVPSCAIRLHGPQASGANYVLSGEDVREYVAILEKHVVPANDALLRGYQHVVVNHLRWRAGYYSESTGKPLPAELAARVETIVRRLTLIPDGLPADDLGASPLISVVVRFDALPQLLRSLGSLDAQVDAPPWEAIVVGEGGNDYSAMLATRPNAARVRFVRADAPDAAAARHLGWRLAGGRIVTYLDPGSAYEPLHLAALAQAFATGAAVVRTPANVAVADSHDGTANTVFRETVITGVNDGADPDRDLIAPAVPIDTVAHLRRAVYDVGPMRSDVPWGAAWEFWLRLRRLGVATVNGPAVRVGVLRGACVPPAEAFLAVARGIYAAYGADSSSPVGRRRDAYLRRMSDWFTNPASVRTDDQVMVNYIADLYGVERLAPVAS